MPSPAVVIATNPMHLQKLVHQEITAHGLRCDLNHIDVSQIEDFQGLFKNTDFKGDISKWDMRNAKNVSHMFQRSAFNGDIGRWDISNVTDAAYMFQDSRFNSDISNWNTGSLVHATGMFKSSAFRKDLSRWDMSNVASTSQMFQDCPFNGDISNWQLDNLTTCRAMFASGKFNGDLTKWNLTTPERYCDCGEMFKDNACFAGDLSHWKLVDDGSSRAMFSNQFKGNLPQSLAPTFFAPFSFYANLFDHDESLRSYLSAQPFCLAHAEILCASAICPPWFPKEDYAWFKDVAALANSIGMEMPALATHVLSQHRERHGLEKPSESWDMGSAVIAV